MFVYFAFVNSSFIQRRLSEQRPAECLLSAMRFLTCAAVLHRDLRLQGELQQPALALDLQLGAGDLLLVLGYGSPEHPEDLLGCRREPLGDEQPQHLDFRHNSGKVLMESEVRSPKRCGHLFTSYSSWFLYMSMRSDAFTGN